jgi:23S rRNA pseudouridine1911/1915/1917 synthase
MTPLFDVLLEDADLLVINKPAGLVCHPTKDGERSSAIGRVRLYLGHAEGRLVNRLDRETSGVLVVAKSGPVASQLGTLFGRGLVEKRYDAIVHGCVPAGSFSIDAPLGKDEASPVAIKDCVRDDGAKARTDVRVVRSFVRETTEFSLVEVTPHSGRKHQIRIHLAHAGHPIVGDKLYGHDEHAYLRFTRGELTAHDRRVLRLDNHALHARALSFTWRDLAWRFEAAASEEFSQFVGP